jgi:hypothetical protein
MLNRLEKDPAYHAHLETMRAETPEPGPIAPVQDDDAEWLRAVCAVEAPLGWATSRSFSKGDQSCDRFERIANRLGKQSLGEGRG